jgi:hypothetical protein
MRYVMLIYESPAGFEARGPSEREPYRAAWRAYYKALVEAGAVRFNRLTNRERTGKVLLSHHFLSQARSLSRADAAVALLDVGEASTRSRTAVNVSGGWL